MENSSVVILELINFYYLSNVLKWSKIILKHIVNSSVLSEKTVSELREGDGGLGPW